MVMSRLTAVLVNLTEIPRVRSGGASRRSSSASDRAVFGQRADALTRSPASWPSSSSISLADSVQFSSLPHSARLSKADATAESSSEANVAACRFSL